MFQRLCSTSIIVGTAFCILLTCPSIGMTGTVARQFQDWNCLVTEDKMTGEKSYGIYTKSLNVLRGWLNKGRLILGYNNRPYVRANNIGFHTDRIDCKEYYDGCKSIQRVRVKVDDGYAKTYDFFIWKDNNDGMSLLPRDRRDFKIAWLEKMKLGNTLYLEVTLFQTKGNEQIAKFSLMGFTKAYNWWCQHTQ